MKIRVQWSEEVHYEAEFEVEGFEQIPDRSDSIEHDEFNDEVLSGILEVVGDDKVTSVEERDVYSVTEVTR